MKFFRPIFAAALSLVPVLADDKPKLPEGPGKATTEKVCGSCHGVGIFVNRRESREGWNGIIEDMIHRGMKGEDEEFGEVSDYLTQFLSKSTPGGKVNVNQGSAKAMVSALGIPEADATAIVKYRVANGKFNSLEDVLKVPGINAAALEKQKEKIDY
ncbi:ComEA family DNA-binding protein [Bryobacter aggregatus]|uniref:ComEA family DNA-binding protein n=1 Tax=Bryobacter aggregatus TaxID=360054 RepID=UPI00138E33E6|nr:helix-hairpin-helix domain-containing protein [Bryobacter aggregatus]